MSTWNMPPGVSTNDIPGNEREEPKSLRRTGRAVPLLIWPWNYPQEKAVEPYLLVVPEVNYTSEEDEKEGYEAELGFELHRLYKPLSCDIVERTEVMPEGATEPYWMWVDENGHLIGKPENLWATELYWLRRKTVATIAGDVAIELSPISDTSPSSIHEAAKEARRLFSKGQLFGGLKAVRLQC